MIKRVLHPFMRQYFSLKFLLGACLVSLVSTVHISHQAEPHRLFSVNVGLTTAAQEANSFGDVDVNDIDNYARAILGIEKIRQSTFSEVQRLLGNETVPAIACHEADSVLGLAESVQNLVADFCQNSIDLVATNNLSITKFNQITSEQRDDDRLARAIQDALVRIQEQAL